MRRASVASDPQDLSLRCNREPLTREPSMRSSGLPRVSRRIVIPNRAPSRSGGRRCQYLSRLFRHDCHPEARVLCGPQDLCTRSQFHEPTPRPCHVHREEYPLPRILQTGRYAATGSRSLGNLPCVMRAAPRFSKDCHSKPGVKSRQAVDDVNTCPASRLDCHPEARVLCGPQDLCTRLQFHVPHPSPCGVQRPEHPSPRSLKTSLYCNRTPRDTVS
jgi:hypothetical protein